MSNIESEGRAAAKAARVSLFALLYAVVALAALHAFRPDIDPATRFVSAYATGSFGWAMRSVFFAMGVSSVALLSATTRTLPGGSSVRIGQTLLGFWAVGVFLVGVFLAGNIYRLLVLYAMPSVVAAMFTLNVGLGRSERLSWVNHIRTALAALALVLLVGGVAVLAPLGLAGIGQRVFLAAVLGWHALSAWRLAAPPNPLPEAPQEEAGR